MRSPSHLRILPTLPKQYMPLKYHYPTPLSSHNGLIGWLMPGAPITLFLANRFRKRGQCRTSTFSQNGHNSDADVMKSVDQKEEGLV